MSTPKTNLSIVMCVHNEEKRLDACLKHLTFADELIIVLDKCTDGSEEIAKSYDAKIISGHYDLEGDRRNLAINTAKSEWILEVDADEIIPAALASEILETIKTSNDTHHLLPFDNYLGERLVRYGWGGSFGTSSVARLFRKGSKHWGNQRVHPKVTFTGTRGIKLQTPVKHYVDRNISAMLKRLDSYSTAKAKDLADNPDFIAGKSRETLRRNVRRLFTRFYKCYISRKGYKEGSMGLLISLLSALFPLLSYLKAVHEGGVGTVKEKTA